MVGQIKKKKCLEIGADFYPVSQPGVSRVERQVAGSKQSLIRFSNAKINRKRCEAQWVYLVGLQSCLANFSQDSGGERLIA